MPVRLMESHPAVVANRNRAAVMRGPLLYCVEAPLAADGERTSGATASIFRNI